MSLIKIEIVIKLIVRIELVLIKLNRSSSQKVRHTF
jgi:hypothetical protein